MRGRAPTCLLFSIAAASCLGRPGAPPVRAPAPAGAPTSRPALSAVEPDPPDLGARAGEEPAGPTPPAASPPGPLAITWQSCASPRTACPPGASFSLGFTNPLDARSLSAAEITVEPALPDLRVAIFGAQLALYGGTRGRAAYHVTLDEGLRDVFGQRLSTPATLTFHVGAPDRAIYATAGPLVVLDPALGPRLTLYSAGHDRLRVRAFEARPESYAGYRRYLRGAHLDDDVPPAPPGRVLLDRIVTVEGGQDEIAATGIDLAGVTPGGVGHLILLVEPGARPRTRTDWQGLLTWVQATRIDLVANADSDGLTVQARDLLTGEALAGVELTLSPARTSAVTGADGVARLPLSASAPAELLVARRGGDAAFLPASPSPWQDGGWSRRPPPTGTDPSASRRRLRDHLVSGLPIYPAAGGRPVAPHGKAPEGAAP